MPHMLQLDDLESCLVVEWVKSGLWLSPGFADTLDIECLADKAAELQGTELPEISQSRPFNDSSENDASEAIGTRNGSTGREASAHTAPDASENGSASSAAVHHNDDHSNVSSSDTEHRSPDTLHQPAGGPSTGASTIDWDVDDLGSRSPYNSRTSRISQAESSADNGRQPADVGSQQSVGQQNQSYVVVAVRLKSGKIVSQVRVCTQTWQPIAVLQPICGEVVTWHFRDWRKWQDNFVFPAQQHQLTLSGGNNSYTATSVSIQTAPPLFSFVMPQPPLTPSDTHFDPKASPQIKAWHTRSGHVLVKPEIDGKVLGFMMLDTGASGLVIENSVANHLEMHSFGEMFVTGMGGPVRGQFRRAKTLELGPVSIERPLFMEMSLAGVVAGAPGPVIGILGYDLFRRCVMQLPPSSHNMSKSPFELSIHDPSTFQNPPQLEHRWQSLKMIANLPHMEVLLTVNADSKPVKCLLMLDSGAGGVDAMFHSRAVKELGLVNSNKHGTTLLTGVGGSSVAGRRVQRAELHSIDLSDNQFNNIKCLFTESDGLDHSLYSSGILCGDIMSRCTVLLDYARSRIMFVPEDGK